MCGIIGYTGSEDVREVLLDALELLEYRGYDSAGIALRDEESGKQKSANVPEESSDLRAICASEKSGVTVRNRSYEMGDAWWCGTTAMHTRIKWEKSRSYTTALLRITGN